VELSIIEMRTGSCLHRAQRKKESTNRRFLVTYILLVGSLYVPFTVGFLFFFIFLMSICTFHFVFHLVSFCLFIICKTTIICNEMMVLICSREDFSGVVLN
jgi:integral membrane sensor domain MASE1